MRSRFRLLVVIGCIALAGVIGSAEAQQKLFFGARHLGMGNTGVGGSVDGLAVHYNPAGMAFSQSWEIQLPLATVDLGLEGDLIGRLDGIGDLSDSIENANIQERLDGIGAPVTRAELSEFLALYLYEVAELSGSTQGAELQGTGGPAFRWKNWGVSVSGFGNGGASATIDLTNGIALTSADFQTAIPNPGPDACGGEPFCEGFATELVAAGMGQLDQLRAEEIAAAAGPQLQNSEVAQDLLLGIVRNTVQGDGTLATNGSGSLTAGIFFVQVAGTYSHKILDNLSVGGNLKYMTGETWLDFVQIEDIADGETLVEDLLDSNNTKSDSDFGVDIGVMWRPAPKWSLGLVGTNVNSPSFEFDGGRSYDLDPSFRAGGAWAPLSWFNAALDVDLNELDSGVIPGLGYRYVNAGVEFRAGRWVALHLGAFTNVASDDQDPSITAGLGLGIGRFELSLAGAASTGSTDVNVGADDKSFPSGASVALQLAWRAAKQQPL